MKTKISIYLRKPWFWLGCVAILFVGILLIGYPYIGWSVEKDTMVYVRPETNEQMLEDSLSAKFGASFATKVKNILDVTGINMKSRTGAYQIEKGMSPIGVAKHLRNGAQKPVKFTFNNLRTKDQFAQAVGARFMASAEDMKRLLNNNNELKEFGCDSLTVTSLLLPDTYEIYWNAPPKKILSILKKYHDQWWENGMKNAAAKLSLSPYEVTILASIVEEETAKSDEKGKVARLYMNRLQRNMPLQADPTVKFAVGDFGLKRITGEHLKIQSPYNTYLVTGLPPAPIRLPSKSTIEAVLNAPVNDYIYMCAKEDFSGYHNFTSSYQEHLKNANRYQKELNKRNIK